MDQATHDVEAPERARTLHGIPYGIRPVGRVEVQAAVGPLSVVVRGVRAKDALEVAPSSDELPVQALRTGRADPPLGEGVRSWSPEWDAEDVDSFGAEHLVERACVLPVAIADEEARLVELVLDGEVPGLLGDPG